MLLVVSLVLGLLILHNIPNGYCNKNVGVGYPLSLRIDESLKLYINVSSPESQGYSKGAEGWMVLNGTVNWIASPQDLIKSLSDVHLVMYTKVDERTYVNGTILTHLLVGIHLEASPKEPQIPDDVIDYKEVIIPTIGLDVSTYQYSLNCSTSISQEDVDGLSNTLSSPIRNRS
jgi:hypothetical protein